MQFALFIFLHFIASSEAVKCTQHFTDLSLQSWLKANTHGIVLIVSDGMPYSQKSIVDVTAEASRRRLPLLILSDSAGSGQQKRCDPLIKSGVLIARGAVRHFPTLMTVKNHQLNSKVIPGIQTPKQLTLNLDEAFK